MLTPTPRALQVPIQKTQAPKVIRVKTDSYKDQDLSPFAARALKKVGEHPIVVHNPYTSWFASGSASRDEVRDLVVQFSVFSNLFLIAQLNKIINSPTLDDMREGKEILANEIGVVFNKGKKEAAPAAGDAAGFDPSLVSVSGTVEGGVYKHRAAHFEWLLDVGESVGLEFKDLGKRRHGTAATLHFCDQLNEIYGSEDPNVSIGASFAIEHWANAGFWDELVMGFKTCAARPRFSARNSRRAILGAQFSDAQFSDAQFSDAAPTALDRYNARNDGADKVPLGFWRFHQALEAQHAAHTMDELEEAYAAGHVTDEAKFEEGANAILDACAVFWDGLEQTRLGADADDENVFRA